jgi:hypothetical protein
MDEVKKPINLRMILENKIEKNINEKYLFTLSSKITVEIYRDLYRDLHTPLLDGVWRTLGANMRNQLKKDLNNETN